MYRKSENFDSISNVGIGGFRGGWKSSLSEIRGGGEHPSIFIKSLRRRLLTWKRPSMTTNRLVKLEEWQCTQRGLFSSNFISSGPRKLNCRILEEGRKFFYFVFNFEQNSFFYFHPSYGILLFLTLKINIETILVVSCKKN